MPLPVIAGLAARTLVGQAARNKITGEVAAQMASRSKPGTVSMKDIKSAANKAIEQKGVERASSLATGYATYQAARAGASFTGGVVNGAVGYALKLSDMEVALATQGLGHAIESTSDAMFVEEARNAAPIVTPGNFTDLHEITTGRVGLSFVFRKVMPGVRDAAISMWRRYGYMVNRRVNVNRLDAFDTYSYWQFANPTVLGNMPADARMDIAAAFERGTTVWTRVNAIGTDPQNNPTAGVTF